MGEPSLDDQLKLATIAKTHAETAKLEKEADAVKANARSEFWSEAIKILGGVVLGIGGNRTGGKGQAGRRYSRGYSDGKT